MKRRIKVLIVDDSALIRKILARLLGADPEIEVVGVASDPYMARERIRALNPDVLTLDVEMPRMDGLTFLRNLMRLRPMPVVMISSLTQGGADVTLEALAQGAVDFVTKPKIDTANTLADFGEEIRAKVKMAAGANLRTPSEPKSVPDKFNADIVLPPKAVKKHFKTTDRIIAIGASTGGTEAIRDVLQMLPADSPAIVIAQHIPEAFSRPFAERMNRSSSLQVKEAEDGDLILPGHVYVAPGGRHLLVIRDGARYRCRLSDELPVNRHRPSVDVLFRSIAQNAGPNAVGVLLTGMGDDGATGMTEMHDAGSPTVCQDESSSVVWGMPGSAVKLGCVDVVLPIDKIAVACMKFVQGEKEHKTTERMM
ncbi:MAG: chemotaxis response regulator protein-glutamate methylesterase [Gammaproteobacteria bacterium]